MTLGVLISGGLDSAILVGDLLAHENVVQPIAIRCGLAWETVERRHLERYLAAIAGPRLKPLVTLEVPVRDLGECGKHVKSPQGRRNDLC